VSFETSNSPGQAYQIEAVVKWFNLTKGFGFVAPADGTADAFLHSSVVSRAGLRDVAEGTKIMAQICDGPKGRQVMSIVQVLGVAPVPNTAQATMPTPVGPVEDMTGTIKWFKTDKGFGFATPDDGGRDVFIHRTVLLRAGLQNVEPGQKVRMNVQTASKGREAIGLQIVETV